MNICYKFKIIVNLSVMTVIGDGGNDSLKITHRYIYIYIYITDVSKEYDYHTTLCKTYLFNAYLAQFH